MIIKLLGEVEILFKRFRKLTERIYLCWSDH